MDPVERNRHREAPMTDDSPDDAPSLGEPETLARLAGIVAATVIEVEPVVVSDDQPRGEIETAAAVKGAQAGDARPEFEQRVETGLLPGEVIGLPGRPAAPYQFSPGDGQAEGQDERNAAFTKALAEQAPSDDDSADDDKGDDDKGDDKPDDDKPKAKKAKKAKHEEQD